MTTVSAVMRRPYSPGMFDDLELPPHTRSWSATNDVTTLTFADEITDEQAAAVWARIESADDDDQAKRAVLRDLLATAEATELDAAGELAVAAMRYWLGD